MRDQGFELEQAVKEKRQPHCVSCGELLDEVFQVQTERICWRWDKSAGRYVKDTDGDSEAPYHPGCNYEDWELVESGGAGEELGLRY